MSYVICHLCRTKVNLAEPGVIIERCPQCQGRLPKDLEIHESSQEAESFWLCPSCLGRVNKNACQNGICPICGQQIDVAIATALGEHADQVSCGPLQRLLRGESASSVARVLQDLGISEELAWRCVDRQLAELPFERYRQEQGGITSSLAPTCDSCGLSDDLAIYEAHWELNPTEMKRYRAGYAGFDGSFSDSKNYARPAVYCLCKRCYKRSGKDDFADGYPRSFGFVLKKIKKRK